MQKKNRFMYIVLSLIFILGSGCITREPITTPETFNDGLIYFNSLLEKGDVRGANKYMERHKSKEPVIFWAFQLVLNESIYDSGSSLAKTQLSYDQFFATYEKMYGTNENLGLSEEQSSDTE